jgi:hypothetical protein
MTLEQMQSLAETDTTPSFSVDELKDKSNRTLMYGYTFERNTVHVYLMDGLLHYYVYDSGEAQLNYFQTLSLKDVSSIVPNKRLYPETCDFEFCQLLRSKGAVMSFTTWTPREPQTFHGLVKV